MNRRGFIGLLLGSVAATAIPVPVRSAPLDVLSLADFETRYITPAVLAWADDIDRLAAGHMVRQKIRVRFNPERLPA